MRWELSDEQGMFRDSLRGWLTRAAPLDAVRDWQDSGDPGRFEDALAAEGWLGVGTPESLGGQGGELIELALAAEEFGRSCAPSGGWLSSVLAVPSLAGRADELAAVLDKGEPTALAVPAEAPLDASAGPLPTLADGAVSGRVDRVLAADRASTLVVPASVDGTCRLVLVRVADEGVSIRGRRLLDRSRSVADVGLDSVPATLLDVDAAAVLAAAALRAAVLVAADALGVMDRMLALSVGYSLQRHQFGVPIGSFQAVKHAAAELLVAVESSRSIVYFAAASVQDAHPEAALHAAAAKAQVTASGQRAADTALTMHGAIGYTWEYELQLLYKRAKLDEQLAGSPARWNERIATLLALAP